MDAVGAPELWRKLNIAPDFISVYDGDAIIDRRNAKVLFDEFWKNAEYRARQRAIELGLNWDEFPDWKKFILADIVYNTGSISGWKQVLLAITPDEVLNQARRKQREIDGRVAKIGYAFGLIKDLEDAHRIGLTGAKYLV